MRSIMIRLTAVLVLAVFAGLACREEIPPQKVREQVVYPVHIKGEPRIRVLVTGRLQHATLSVSGAYTLTITDLSGRESVGGGKYAVSVMVRPAGRGIMLGEDHVLRATVSPAPGRLVEIAFRDRAGRTRKLAYNKPMTLVPGKAKSGNGPGFVRAIITLGLEEYIVGVVSGEMYPNWPLEALRAQAVASRTFALYKIRTRKKYGWDVSATVNDQVWRPFERPNPRVLMAVNSTRGIVMLDDNRLFPAFFHSQCGGYTANAKGVLLARDIKALWSVRCPYCSSPKAKLKKWRLVIAKQDLSRRLASIISGQVTRIRLLDAYGRRLRAMGRVHTVELTMKDNTVFTVPLNSTFRRAVGNDAANIASTWFGVVESRDHRQFVFEGLGAGHGVGMCQYGAMYMAGNRKASFQDILARFYIGSSLARLWK